MPLTLRGLLVDIIGRFGASCYVFSVVALIYSAGNIALLLTSGAPVLAMPDQAMPLFGSAIVLIVGIGCLNLVRKLNRRAVSPSPTTATNS